MTTIQNIQKLFIKLGFIVLLLLPVLSIAQSLTYEDLSNLQENNLEKAKGFFNYKGWTWGGTTKDCDNCLQQSGYDLSYDKTVWTNNGESIQFLQKAGYANAVIYYLNQYSFNTLETEVKNHLSPNGTGTLENSIWSSYKSQFFKFSFYQKKTKEYYSEKTSYYVIISDENDLKNRIAQLCSNCKGKGQIVEHEKCSYCAGDGKQNCNNCRGKGNLNCNYCQEGKVQCNSCWGKGAIQCNKCYQQGKINCSKCYGQGTYNCTKCYGSGQVTQNVPGYSFQRACTSCEGKGKFTCANCGGDGSLRCETCAGIGTLPCPKSVVTGTTVANQNTPMDAGSCQGGKVNCQQCKGIYSKTCTKCYGSGNTDLVCSSCNGKGITNREINKICPVCNGSKLKQAKTTNESTKTVSSEGSQNEEIFTIVEQMPQFPGGAEEMYKFINNNILYPDVEKANGIEGTVYVSFVVNKTGKINDVKVMRGVPGGANLEKEALRVVNLMPDWSPGKQNGKEVLVQFYLPMKFVLP